MIYAIGVKNLYHEAEVAQWCSGHSKTFQARTFQAELVCFPCVCVGFLGEVQFPTTSQKLAMSG